DHRHGLEHGFLLGLLGRGISPRRNCGGHFPPKTGAHKVCFRSKAQRLGTSTCFSLLPPKVGLPPPDMPRFPFPRPRTCSSARPPRGSRAARRAGTRATWILLSRE